MSYFDGALYNRQSVTINNTDNKTIVQETIYDVLGRPAVNVLPAPANDSTIHFFRAFNKNEAGVPYSFSDLSATAACVTNAQPMGTLSGASQYYSPANPFLTRFYYAKYIPDAEKFPFTVTEYVADNTGRILAQGGVGPTFQIGSEHETKYFYGKPNSQTELDRLFGSEAGNLSHYLKNMVADPNGQISVSYMDAGGRTVATALAGNPAANLHALPSTSGAITQISKDLIQPESFTRNASDYSLVASATFLAPVTGDYTFNYKVDPLRLDVLHGPNQDSAICNTCYYDMEITIKDNCNNTLRQETHAAGTVFDTACAATIPPIQDTMLVSINKIGEYYVTYTLRVSKDAVDYFDSVHLEKNSNLRKFNSFLLEELKETDFYGCFSDCSSCLEELGTQQEFVSRFKSLYVTDSISFDNVDSLWVLSLYDSLLVNCQSLQSECAQESVCSDKLQILKLDVTPGAVCFA